MWLKIKEIGLNWGARPGRRSVTSGRKEAPNRRSRRASPASPADVPSGSAERGKKRASLISQSGARWPRTRKARTRYTATWSRRDARALKKTPCSSGGAFERDVRLLLELARQRLHAGLSDLDAPAGKMPAGDVAVPDQQHALVAVDHHRAHAERHRPGDEKAQSARSATSAGLESGQPCCTGSDPGPSPGLSFPSSNLIAARSMAAACRTGRSRMSFTIAHITDPHLSPAPMPGFADLRLKRVMGFINWKRGRERLNDMAPAGAARRGFARAAPRSCRRHRRSRQYRHAGRVPARGAVDEDARRPWRRQLRSRQSRRLRARGHAASRDDVCALDHRR